MSFLSGWVCFLIALPDLLSLRAVLFEPISPCLFCCPIRSAPPARFNPSASARAVLARPAFISALSALPPKRLCRSAVRTANTRPYPYAPGPSGLLRPVPNRSWAGGTLWGRTGRAPLFAGVFLPDVGLRMANRAFHPRIRSFRRNAQGASSAATVSAV